MDWGMWEEMQCEEVPGVRVCPRGCGKCALKLLCVCLVGTVSSE